MNFFNELGGGGPTQEGHNERKPVDWLSYKEILLRTFCKWTLPLIWWTSDSSLVSRK